MSSLGPKPAHKPWHSSMSRSNASTNPYRIAPKSTKGGTPRTASTIRRLNMYRQRAKRDKNGKIVHQAYKSKALPNTRIQPDRRWFGNVHSTTPQKLEKFRAEMEATVNDPYQFVLKQHKVPMSLLTDPKKVQKLHVLEVESYESTFGKRATRKRPKIGEVSTLEELAAKAEASTSTYREDKDSKTLQKLEEQSLSRKTEASVPLFTKGQSKRIWQELYKVLDCSDVVVQVLDARNPLGTRCGVVEKHLRKNAKHKHMILLLNKCDLIPVAATERWVKELSRDYPTIAFHASITNSFGKGTLIQLLRQFGLLHKEKHQISVGFIGYPNVGKSSVINTIRAKKVCKVAPVPGETKVWQYITLMRRIFLIDCPGIVVPTDDDETDLVLKSVVRIERLNDCTEYVAQALKHIKHEYLERTYGISEWVDHEDFLEQFARKSGRLLKGGEPDIATASRMFLHHWQRGKIPWFFPPPGYSTADIEKADAEMDLSINEVVEEEVADDAEELSEDLIKADPTDEEGQDDALESMNAETLSVKQNFGRLKMRDFAIDMDEEQDVPDGEEAGSTDGPASVDTESAAAANGEASDKVDFVDWDEVLESVVGEVVQLDSPEELARKKEEWFRQKRLSHGVSTKPPSKKQLAREQQREMDNERKRVRVQPKEKRKANPKRKVGVHFYEANRLKKPRKSRVVDPAAPKSRKRPRKERGGR